MHSKCLCSFCEMCRVVSTRVLEVESDPKNKYWRKDAMHAMSILSERIKAEENCINVPRKDK